MYLRGSKFNMNRRKKGINPFRILVMLVLAGIGVYFSIFVVPSTPPLFIPTTTPTRAPESYVNDAQDLESAGKFSQAITAFKQASQSDPKNPVIFTSLARLYIYTGNYDEAVKNAENALLLNPNYALAQALRGYALGLQGSYLEAEGALQKALELDANSPITYAYYTEVLVMEIANQKDELGTLEKAKGYSRTAQTLGPNMMETHRARGDLLEITSNFEEAIAEFQAAIAINPNIADLHLALGRNYRNLQQYAKAIEEFNRANSLNPFDPLANQYISRTYLANGDYAKAIQYALAAIKVSPVDPYLFGNLGVMYYHNKQYMEAVDPLRKAVRGGTTSDGAAVKGLPLDYGTISEYYSTYGRALAHTGECTEALQISQLIQSNVPNDEDAVYNAQQIPKICQELISGTATPTRPATPGTGATVTPKP
jgi:tetratricopeptide (TPR) repeat protein